MDVEEYCRQSKVVVVVGKGGVGKTTVSAAFAVMAAEAGLEVLIVALEPTGHIERMFDSPEPLRTEDTILRSGEKAPGDDQLNSGRTPTPGRIRARLITAEAALRDYLGEHGFGGVARRIVDAGALDVVATAAPGVRDLLILNQVKQLAQDQSIDLILVDAPATGHALTFLTSPIGLADAARGGPLRTQAELVASFLTDASRCQVQLVTIPEETPINEAIETGYRIEDTIGVRLAPVIINGCYTPLEGLAEDPVTAAAQAGIALSDEGLIGELRDAATFRLARQQLQQEQCERLSTELPLRQLRLSYLFATEIAKPELVELAHELRDQVAAL